MNPQPCTVHSNDVPAESRTATITASPLQSSEKSSGDYRPWVLCIDDDQEFSEGLKLQMQQRGFDVVRSFKGMDGYRQAFEIDPVAILLDLYMPDSNGEEVLSQLRFHPSTAHIPVFILTGLNEPGLKMRLLAAGASGLFQKPIAVDRVVEAIRKAVGSTDAYLK